MFRRNNSNIPYFQQIHRRVADGETPHQGRQGGPPRAGAGGAEERADSHRAARAAVRGDDGGGRVQGAYYRGVCALRDDYDEGCEAGARDGAGVSGDGGDVGEGIEGYVAVGEGRGSGAVDEWDRGAVGQSGFSESGGFDGGADARPARCERGTR